MNPPPSAGPGEAASKDPQSSGPPGERRQWIWLGALILVWAVELLCIQEITAAVPGDLLPSADVVKYAARRMVLNVAACAFLACALNRFWLYLAFGAQWFAAVVLFVYADYFEAPLSWFTLQNQWREGAAVAGFGFTLIPWPVALVLLLAMALKIGLREVVHRLPLSSPRIGRVGWAAAAVYAGFALGLAGWHKPITKLRLASPEYTYGYVVAWLSEGLSYDREGLLRLALDKARQRSDRLAGQEAPQNIGDRLAIVQVESLDFDVVDARVGDQWAMPFLQSLKDRSLYYAVEPLHLTGSSDADFALLTGCVPNGRIAPYKVLGYPYTNTLPQIGQALGYSTVSLHGYSGNFFARRPAFKQMGFTEIYFADDLARLGCSIVQEAVDDDEVLRRSAERLRQASTPVIHFIITFTSHGPFDRVPEAKRELFPKQRGKTEGYLNSMRYVDRALESYVAAVPEHTMIVLYGDHASGVRGYQQPPVAASNKIPWLIHRKGMDLARSQSASTRPGAASPGASLGMLDLVTYLHTSLKTTQRPPGSSVISGDGAPAQRH